MQHFKKFTWNYVFIFLYFIIIKIYSIILLLFCYCRNNFPKQFKFTRSISTIVMNNSIGENMLHAYISSITFIMYSWREK